VLAGQVIITAPTIAINESIQNLYCQRIEVRQFVRLNQQIFFETESYLLCNAIREEIQG